MTLPQRKSPQAIQRDWQTHLRNNADIFQSTDASPQQLHFLARLYFARSAVVVGDTARKRLRHYFDDDKLAELALDALATVPSRPDLPGVQEIIDSSRRGRIPYLVWPLLAGLAECWTRNAAPRLPDSLLRRALVAHAIFEPIAKSDQPEWHRWAATYRPELVAETIVLTYRAALRDSRIVRLYGLHGLIHDHTYAEVARLSVPSLLRAFPSRARSDQLAMLTPVLAAALSHCEPGEFYAVVDRKLAAKSMGAKQKLHWLCAGLLRRPATYLAQLERELDAGASQRRVRYVGEFLGSGGINRHLGQLDHIGAAELLIRRIGAVWRPFPERYPAYGTTPGETVVPKLIHMAARSPDIDATALLQALTRDPSLAPWYERLQRAAHTQRDMRRNMEFRFPPLRNILDALAGGAPANAGDLAALAYEELSTLGRNIRDGQTSDWRQYWRSEHEPQPENDCRDRLLSDLSARLRRFDVAADKEPTYADDKRADIRVSHGGFNVPIEIKRSNSSDLWSTVERQLIPKYTRDPYATGHGIFLVFWFGQRLCKPPRTGKPPGSAADLQQLLDDTLTTEVARLVRVLVIDVSRPQADG